MLCVANPLSFAGAKGETQTRTGILPLDTES